MYYPGTSEVIYLCSVKGIPVKMLKNKFSQTLQVHE